MPRPTRIGLLFLGVTAFFYFAALTSQSGLLLTLMGVLGGCYFVNYTAARRAVRSLSVEAPPIVRLVEGGTTSETWRVLNSAARTSGPVEIRSSAGTLLRVGPLAAGTETRLPPQLARARRGVHLLTDVRAVSGHPFGLLTTSRALGIAGEILVHPAIYRTAAPPAAGYDVTVGGRHHGTRRTTSGTHFAGVRPLQPGDPFRQIHWKSSARGLGLMVKTFDEELAGRVALLLDGGQPTQATRFDDAVRAAGSLMFAALDAGHHAEWISLAEMQPRLVPPFADGVELLDDLTRLNARADTLTEDNLRAALARLSPRAALLLVLTEWNATTAAFVDGLIARGRPVSVYVPAELKDEMALPVPTFAYATHSIEPSA